MSAVTSIKSVLLQTVSDSTDAQYGHASSLLSNQMPHNATMPGALLSQCFYLELMCLSAFVAVEKYQEIISKTKVQEQGPLFKGLLAPAL